MNYKKLAILIGIPLVLAILWVLAVYLPIEAQAQKKQIMVKTVINERKDLETSIIAMSQQAQNQESLKKSYNDFLSQTPTIDRMPGFMSGLVRDARLKGMAVERLDGHYGSMDTSQKGIINPVFELSLKGSFLDMGKFLEELSEKTAYKDVQKARIAYEDKDNSVLTGRFVIEFKTLKGRSLESK